MAVHWNAEKLDRYLSRIDGAIFEGRYSLAVKLAHRCLRQYYHGFIADNQIALEHKSCHNVRVMAIHICRYLNAYFRKYNIPYSERRIMFISLVSNITFIASLNLSEQEDFFADKALATYARENVSSIIQYLMGHYS